METRSRAIEEIRHFPARPDLLPSCQFSKGLCGYKDADGHTKFEPQFDWADAFQDGFASVALDGLYGFIDETGRLAVEAKFLSVGRFRHGLAEAATADGHGVIDTSGKWVFQPHYLRAFPISSDHIWTIAASSSPATAAPSDFSVDLKFISNGPLPSWIRHVTTTFDPPIVVRNKSENVVRQLKVMPLEMFSADKVIAKSGLSMNFRGHNLTGVVNSAGEFINSPSYWIIKPLRDSWAGALRMVPQFDDPKLGHVLGGYLDDMGREVEPVNTRCDGPCSYVMEKASEANSVTHEPEVATKDGKWGVVDKQGNWVIPAKFDGLRGPFSFGLMPAKQDGRWG